MLFSKNIWKNTLNVLPGLAPAKVQIMVEITECINEGSFYCNLIAFWLIGMYQKALENKREYN